MKLKAKLTNTKGLLLLDTDCDVSSISDGFYTVDLKPYRSCRSLEQNSKLWATIQELANITGNDSMDIYIAALENADAKYEWIAALESAEDDLKRVFRAIKPYGVLTTENGTQLIRYKCWIGSSKYNTEEMCKLIDFVERELENV